MKILGIDLGTTNSCFSVLEGGVARVIPNTEGSRTTPSVVSFGEDGEWYVGQVARRQMVSKPKRTVYAVKRLMGRSFSDKVVQEIRDSVPYEVVEMEGGAAGVQIGDKVYSPQEISSMLLSHMRDVAESYVGEEIKKAVITVPAYFNDAQRQATRDSGRIAGLDVVRVINEPTAASLAYGIDREATETIAVYDFGGGTFDVSILRLENGLVEVISTAGDTHLGGEDFDRVLQRKLLDEFEQAHGVDLSSDLVAVQRVKDAAESAKQELSVSEVTEIQLPFLCMGIGGPLHLSREVTRSELESLCSEFVERSLIPCEQALKDAKLTRFDISKVLLVGGMTRMPLIRSRVKEFFGVEVVSDLNPDEVVSVGASLQGGIMGGEVAEVLLLDVCPLSLGIETMGGVFQPLIARNTPIPCEAKEVFTTTQDFQEMVRVHVLQGEREIASENMSLAMFELYGIAPAVRGVPQVEVSFGIDANGIVSVKARELLTGVEQSVRIESSCALREDLINSLIKEAEEHRQKDKERLAKIEIVNKGKGFLYMLERMLTGYKSSLSASSLESAEKSIRQAWSTYESFADASMKDLEDIHVELERLAMNLSQEAFSAGKSG